MVYKNDTRLPIQRKDAVSKMALSSDLSPSSDANLSRGGAVAARRAHNPKVVGSNPTPATNIRSKKQTPDFRNEAGGFNLTTIIAPCLGPAP